MSIEAMKQAFEALNANDNLINGDDVVFGLAGAPMDGYYGGCFDVDGVNKKTHEAITALRTAIEQAEKQAQPAPASLLRSTIADDTWAMSFQSLGQYRSALLKLIDTAAPAAQPAVPLTEKAIVDLMPKEIPAQYDGALIDFVRAIEAKLKGEEPWARSAVSIAHAQ
jgi:hypothetical protein